VVPQVADSPRGRAGPPLDQLIAASAHGDELAFRRLYEATVDTLYGVALRVVRRPDWAEEVVQESFISVWRHARRFDGDKGAPMTWMIRIVRNQAFDWIRPSGADGYERVHGESLDAFGDERAGATFDDVEQREWFQRAERVSACLKALDARQRQSLALVFFHGLSHGDLAAHLQQPLGTVKAWVRRGLKSLRACLGAQF
jgi:RNA polymerase sigma-70 factor (ECF subfamily)